MKYRFRQKSIVTVAALFAAAAISCITVWAQEKPIVPSTTPVAPTNTVPLPSQNPPSTENKPAVPLKNPPNTLSLIAVNGGNYSYWVNGKNGATTISSISKGTKSVLVEMPPDAQQLFMVSDADGKLAIYDARRFRNGGTLKSSYPADFKRLRYVVVKVESDGKPVEKAIVTLQESKTKAIKRHVLTAADNGSFRFENVLIGEATATAAYGRETIKGTIEIKPGIKGNPREITLVLPNGMVPVLGGSTKLTNSGDTTDRQTADTKAAANDKVDEKPGNANPWIVGIPGAAILGGLIYLGIHFVRQRSITVPEVLEKMGVTSTETESAPSRYQKSEAMPEQPPLPSLHDSQPLPDAKPVVAVPIHDSAYGIPPVPGSSDIPTGLPHLIGIAGDFTGQTFELRDGGEPLTIGREPENRIALARDTTVSRRHAEIFLNGGGWQIRDLGSSNGTYVNGSRVQLQTLHRGDEILLGTTVRFRFEG